MTSPRVTPSSDALSLTEAAFSFVAGFAFMASILAGGWLLSRLARRYLT